MSFGRKWQPDDVPIVIRKDYGHGIQSGSSKSRSDTHEASSDSNRQESYWKQREADEDDLSKAEDAVKFLTHLGVTEEVLSDLPTDLLKLFEYKHCGLCDFSCNINGFTKMHYLSKSHRNKTRIWLMEWNKDDKKKMNTCASSSVLDTNPSKTLLPRDVYCELCDVQITSPALFQSHYTGIKHKNTVLRRREPRNDTLKLPENKDRLDQLIERESTMLDVKPVEKTKSVVPKTDSIFLTPKFRCDICQVLPISEEQLVLHKNSKKHLAKEKEHILRITRCEDEPILLTKKDRMKILLENIKCEVVGENDDKEEGNEATEENIGLEDGCREQERYSHHTENSQAEKNTCNIEIERSTEAGNSSTGVDLRSSDSVQLIEKSAEVEEDAEIIKGDEATEDNAATQDVDNQNSLLLPRDAYCELCDVEITSLSLFNSHYSGYKHKRTVLKWKQPRNIELLQAENKTRLNLLIKRESLILGLGYTEEEKKSDDTDLSRDLYCSICKVKPLTEEQMAAHLAGKRHLANVEATAKTAEDETVHRIKRKRGAEPLHREDITSQHKDIPLLHKDIPSQHKDIPLLHKDIPSQHKDIPLLRKDIPSQHKDIPILHKDIPSQHKDIPLLHKDIPSQHKDIRLLHKDIPSQHKDIPSHPKDITYKENDKFVSSVKPTENKLPVLNNGSENVEEIDDYFERLCEAIDSTRTIEVIQNNCAIEQKTETSSSFKDSTTAPRFNPHSTQTKFRKLELYKYVCSSDTSDSSDTDMDLDPS